MGPRQHFLSIILQSRMPFCYLTVYEFSRKLYFSNYILSVQSILSTRKPHWGFVFWDRKYCTQCTIKVYAIINRNIIYCGIIMLESNVTPLQLPYDAVTKPWKTCIRPNKSSKSNKLVISILSSNSFVFLCSNNLNWQEKL